MQNMLCWTFGKQLVERTKQELKGVGPQKELRLLEHQTHSMSVPGAICGWGGGRVLHVLAFYSSISLSHVQH